VNLDSEDNSTIHRHARRRRGDVAERCSDTIGRVLVSQPTLAARAGGAVWSWAPWRSWSAPVPWLDRGFAVRQRVAVLPWIPLARGLLAGNQTRVDVVLPP
jgi:hypothetical protein